MIFVQALELPPFNASFSLHYQGDLLTGGLHVESALSHRELLRSKMGRKTLVSHNLPKGLHCEMSYHYLQCFVFTSVMILNIPYLRISSKVSFNTKLFYFCNYLHILSFFKKSLRVRSESMHFTRQKY